MVMMVVMVVVPDPFCWRRPVEEAHGGQWPMSPT